MDELEYENLMEQISLWNMDDEFIKIIEAIEKIPEEQRGFDLNLKLARIYDKLAVFGDKCCYLEDDAEDHDPDIPLLEKSLALLDSVSEEGKDDPRWYSRMAYTLSYFSDERAKEAMKYAQRWKELEPDNESADDLIQMLESSLAEPEMYDEDEMLAVENHIEKYFGNFDSVYHEIVSPDIHVDIVMIPPRPGHNFYTLVTMGMGAHKMNVPKELEKGRWERAELLINLPPYWQMDKLDDERWYWPFRTLKSIARLPINENSWVAWGHTISLGAGETYAVNTELCGALLISPGDFPTGSASTVLPSGDTVTFYQLVTLYAEEIDFKINNGAPKLLDLFIDDKTLNVTDIKRPSVIL